MKVGYFFGIAASCLLYLTSFMIVSGPSVFSNLDMAVDYAQRYPEYPDIDNIDWKNPDYSSYLKNLIPGRTARFLSWTGLQKQLWTARDFKELLKQITRYYELNGFIGQFILKIEPTPDSEFVVFGDLHGAFHSFVRDLQFLQIRGMIGKDLLIKKNCYFVFNGNVVDQSPYSLELLTLVMQIMLKNPAQALYIKGSHEDKEQWQNYSLKRDLSIRVKHLSDEGYEVPERIPLGRMMNRFFETLPLAVYIIAGKTAEKIEVVRISHCSLNCEKLKEQNFAGFLNMPASVMTDLFKLRGELTSNKQVDVAAFITGERLDVFQKKTIGLRALGKEKGVRTWAILSSKSFLGTR